MKLRYQIIILIAAAFAGLLIGHFVKPKVNNITHETVKTQTVTKIQYQDRLVTQIKYIKNKAENKTTVTTDKKPTGEVITTTVADNVETNVNKNTDQTDTKTIASTSTSKTETVIDAGPPKWRLGASVGYNFLYLNGQSLGIPGMKGTVVGLELDRNILGGFYIGLSVTTQATISLRLNYQW